MPLVLVHGVPETPSVWGPLVDALGVDDVVTPRLPGFGAELPPGFEPVMDAYASWLAAELAALDGPIDLVGHDWGAILCLRVLADRPANVRSWTLDAANIDAGFQWHDMARVWQTPGEGEQFWADALAAPLGDRAALLEGTGVPADFAPTMAQEIDETMAAALLGLYRSATDIGARWGPGIDDIGGPGLIIDAANDPFRSTGATAALALRTGARRVELAEQGHWWMVGDPTGAADVLTTFWESLPA